VNEEQANLALLTAAGTPIVCPRVIDCQVLPVFCIPAIRQMSKHAGE
jgi:hypothetical protein